MKTAENKKFELITIDGVQVGVRKYRKGDYGPIFVQIPKVHYGDEEDCGLIGGRAEILKISEAKDIIKALQSAIDHVEKYK